MSRVHGNFVLALHYNGNDDIPAEKIPKWVRLATPGETARFSRSLSDAVIRCLRLLDDCDNALLLTSGSLFIRTWTIPNKLGICLTQWLYSLHFYGYCGPSQGQIITMSLLNEVRVSSEHRRQKWETSAGDVIAYVF